MFYLGIKMVEAIKGKTGDFKKIGQDKNQLIQAKNEKDATEKPPTYDEAIKSNTRIIFLVNEYESNMYVV